MWLFVTMWLLRSEVSKKREKENYRPLLKSGAVVWSGGGGGIVWVIIITQPIKTEPLLVNTTGHNSPRRFRSGAVSVPSSSFTHSITVGCSRRAGERASEGLLVDGVGARPVRLNSFALKPTIEAAEAGASASTVRVSLTPLVCACSGRTKTRVPAPRNQQERGFGTCPVLLHNWFSRCL